MGGNADGKVIISAEIETKSFDKQIQSLEDKLDGLEEEYEAIKNRSPFKGQKEMMQQYEYEIEKTKNTLIGLYQKQKTENDKQKNDYDSLGDKLKGIIEKVGKWGLAIFGIRTAYSAVQKAIAKVSEYDKGIATDLEYISYSVAMVLQPVIRWIVDAVMKLMQYVNYIWQKLFNKSLFNKSAQDFAKARSDVQAIEKSVAGFDEMNVLSDNSSKASVGASMDLSEYANIEIPDWVKEIANVFQWILDHGELVADILIIIGSAILGLKVSEGLTGGLLGLATALSTLAVIEWTKIVKGYKEVANSISDVNNQIERNKILNGETADVFVEKIKMEELDNETIKEAIKLQKDQIDNKAVIKGIEETLKYTPILTKARKEEIKALRSAISSSQEYFNNLVKETNAVGINTETRQDQIDGIITAIDVTKTGIRVLNKNLQNYDEEVILLNEQRDALKKLIDEQYKDIDVKIKTMSTMDKNSEEYKNYQTEIQNAITKLESANKKLEENGEEYKKNKDKIQELKDKMLELNGVNVDVKPKVETADADSKLDKVKETLANIFGLDYTVKVKGDTSNLKTKLNNVFNSTGFKVMSVMFPALPAIGTIGNWLTKLNTGGVINMPGRGVMVGGAIGGERGPEGVIPLTNSQMMEQLGATIGRYITINANITNSMDGRVISKEIKRIQNQMDFASNR